MKGVDPNADGLRRENILKICENSDTTRQQITGSMITKSSKEKAFLAKEHEIITSSCCPEKKIATKLSFRGRIGKIFLTPLICSHYAFVFIQT